MDTTAIRNDFMSLKDGLVYLDSAATSLTPEPVLEAMNEYYRNYRANVHRGLYAEAERATERYEEARKNIAAFIGATADEVIFTSSATAASNMLVYALEHTLELQEGDEIVTTVMEHHAMLLPLQELAKRNGLVVKYAQLTKDFALDLEDLRELITEKTRIVAVTGASNVTGRVACVPEDTLTTGARPVIVRDMTACVGHMPVNMSALDADFAFFSGHKMCGPTGTGVLYGKKEWLDKLRPGYFGGGMVDSVTLDEATYHVGVPGFEAGTANVGGVIGLGAAVSYLTRIGMDEIRAHVEGLTNYAFEKLGALEGVTLYAAPPEVNVGIVSLTLVGVHPHDVAEIAGQHNVAVRAGHHCALPLHNALGVVATTRASFYLYNTRDDIDALVEAVNDARRTFN